MRPAQAERARMCHLGCQLPSFKLGNCGVCRFPSLELGNLQTILISDEKPAHVFKIALGKPTPKLLCQLVSQPLNQHFSVSSAVLTALFMFNNMPPDFKIGAHLHQVHPTRHGLAGADNEVAHQRIQAIFSTGGLNCFHFALPRSFESYWPLALM